MKHKKRLSGRFMAFLLTAVLVFSSLSLSAFAGTSDDESADAAEAVTAAEETVTAAEDDAATADDDEYSSLTLTSSNYTNYLTDTSSSGYVEFTGYYYLVNGTYYQVYYTVSLVNGNYDYTLYYTTDSGVNYTTITTLGGGPNSSNTATVYYKTSTDGDNDSDNSGSVSYELDLSAYRGSAYVYWDMDDSSDAVYTSSYSTYVSSVTLTSADYSSATAQTVNNFSSTNSNFITGSYNESNSTTNSEDSISWDTTTAKLSNVYLDSSGTAIADGTSSTDATEANATLTITPADGYYVTNVIVTCAAYISDNNNRISPYYCGTYTEGNAYDGNFTLSNTSDSSFALSTGITNEYFSHSGYANYTQSSSSDAPVVYFILIEVEKIPTPAYVEYDFGEIVKYIQAASESDSNDSSNSTSAYSAFSTASGWTDASTFNVYKPSGSSTTGSILTEDTQFMYTYDNSSGSTESYTSWKHYANTITDNAVSQAAAAGYAFAGWAVTYYTTATATQNSGTSNYNNYTISFSSSSITTLAGEGDEVYIAGNVRLVAQWVKIEDFTQVIDYGLPVSLDIIEELGDALTLQALTANISSRTSATQDLYESFRDSDYTELEVSATLTGFAAIESEESEGSGDTEDSGNSDDSEDSEDSEGSGETSSASEDGEEESSYDKTLTGTYGAFSINGDGDAVYTLSEQMTGVESAEYAISLTYSNSVIATPTGAISIVPATSMYYEENFGTAVSSDDKKTISYGLITYSTQTATWTSTGTTLTDYQETGLVGDTTDSTYGTDTVYLKNLGDSYGTSMYVDTSNAAAQFSYTFTGTGTAIYARTLTDESAYIRVTIKSASANDDGTYAVNNTQYIDTRIVRNIDNETILYNIPVYDYTGLDYGTYTVTVLVYKEGMTVSSTVDDDGNTLADSTSGDDFYLDGIRIYGPVKTNEEVNSAYETVGDVYEADGEANTTFLNVHDYLCSVSDALSSETFITVTDLTTGTITDYDDYFAVGPNNEVYLAGTSSSSSDGDTSTTDDTESTETTYQLSFYLLNWNSDNYDLYLGMKAPDGGAATVKIGNDKITLKNSADCYYDVGSYLTTTDITSLNLTDDNGSKITTAYKLTITGVTNLSAITWIKVTSSGGEYDIAFDVDIESENEDVDEDPDDDEGSEDTDSGSDETETIATLDSNTIYMVSETAYAALTSADTDNEDAYDGEEDGDLQDEDGDSGNEDSDTEDDSDTTEPETENDEDTEEPESEEDEETLFEPESFTVSISYLKLLKYASITVKTSSDVDYITINGTKVTGRSTGKSGTKTFSYSSMKVSSGTTFEIVAYNFDGQASEPITLTAG